MKVKEKVMEYVFLLCACVSILAVALICIFLFANGLPAMKEIGVFDFLLGKRWKPGNDIYGIFPMILGSIYVTAGAIIVGVPIGLLTAVYLAKFCPAGLYKIIKPGIDLLAGIPSVVYGFFGLCVIVPAVRTLFKDTFGGNGQSIFTASVLLGIMILPTIIGIAESAIRAVPERYYQGALALGATHERAVFLTVVPAAKSGIMAGIVLGIILHKYVIFTTEVDLIMFGRQIYVQSYIYSILLTIAFSILVNAFVYFQLKKIDMVESLKSTE